MSASTIDIIALDRAGLDRHLDRLAETLRACVHAGASVNFILPYENPEARDFWLTKTAPGVAAGTRILLVAMVNNEIAGTVQLDLATPPNQRHRAEVTKLLVHPDYRRLGIARALMFRLEADARERQRSLLTLDTASEAAETLYAELGYERAGTIPGYARGPIEDRLETTVIMFKHLAPR
jgi:ribosomal protein S18 acetylase RimI-like enzyme